MIIPQYRCTKCNTRNPEVVSNLRIGQTGKDALNHEIGFNLKSVVVECKKCLRQKTIQVR